MKECENCKELDKRMLKWIDHVGCSPNKYQRYDRLLFFVKSLVSGSKIRDSNDIAIDAELLLKDIGEN